MSRTRWILLAGWTLFVIHAYPGLVSPAAIAELTNARTRDFVAGVEPAAVTALWAALDFVIAGPFGMIAAASLCLLGGTYSLAKRSGVAETRAALLAACVLLFPPVLAGISIASGFMLFAGFSVLGTALVAGECRWARAGGLALLSLAATMRFGGAIGTLPLVFAMPLGGVLVRRVVIALGLWAATVAISFGLGRVVTTESPGASIDASGAFTEALVRIPSPTSRDSQPAEALRALDIQVGYGAVQGVTDAITRGARVAMTPILWCVLAIALLVWQRRDRRRSRSLVALLASGVAVEMSQLYFASDGLYERSHWLVATVAISGGIAIVRALRREPETA